jgi:hypothetical protein
MSVLEISIKNFETNFIFLCDIPFFESLENFPNDEFYSFRQIREKKNNVLDDYPEIFNFQLNQDKFENPFSFNFRNYDNFNFFSNYHSSEFNCPIEKGSEYFFNNDMKNFSCGKRRKRRKFNTDGERKFARLLKNRRTAEESRQRRIQKMKELESYTSVCQERENQLKEEIQYLKNQNAFQLEEINYLKTQNINQAAEIFHLRNGIPYF